MKTDVLIVGSGCSGLYLALQLPDDMNILIITKKTAELSDSFLAQGGICMLKDENDYDSYFEDTMKAGHYENDVYSVELMIKSSPDVIQDLISMVLIFKKMKMAHLPLREKELIVIKESYIMKILLVKKSPVIY